MIDLDKKLKDLLPADIFYKKNLFPYGYAITVERFEWVQGPVMTNFALGHMSPPIGNDPVTQEDVLDNHSDFDTELSTSFEISRGQSESMEISENHQFSIGVSVSVGYESPIGVSVGAEVNTSYTYDRGEVRGHSVDTSRTAATEYKVNVPAKSRAIVKVLSSKHAIKAPYSAVMDFSEASVIVELSCRCWLSTEIFEHGGYRGKKHKLGSYDEIPDLRAIGFDDTISSCHLIGAGSALLYEHPNYEGAVKRLTVDCGKKSVGMFGGRWNDKVSSIRQERKDDERTIRQFIRLKDVIDIETLNFQIEGIYNGEGVNSTASITGSPLEAD